MSGRALLVAIFWALLSIVGLGCSGQLANQAGAGAVVLGTCVASCAAGCVSSVLEPGTGSARAERYGRCLAPCSARCIPDAALVVFGNPPGPCARTSRPPRVPRYPPPDS
jgi:hypothetical protein